MQDIDLDSLVNSNKWISKARVQASREDGASSHICIDISDDGHELLRTQGLKVFKGQALSSLHAGLGWEFDSKDVIFPANSIENNSHDLPPVLSIIQEPDRCSLLLDIKQDSPWFIGHFPGYPVLAGIVQLHWATLFSCGLFDFHTVPSKVERLKYKNVITPPAIVELSLHQIKTGEVQFEFNSPDKTHSMGRLIFTPENS